MTDLEGFDVTLLSESIVVYYESIKRELKTKPIYECRCDERLKAKSEESTRHSVSQTYTSGIHYVV